MRHVDKLNLEETNEKIVAFRGALIPQFEMDVLQELIGGYGVRRKLKRRSFKRSKPEKEIFYLVDTTKYTKQGFSVENNHIIGIALNKCGLRTIPNSISNLTSL